MAGSPAQLDIYRTALGMRRFEHAAAGRQVAEAIVVRLELADGAVGWGETLPREYVTGETLESVPRDIEEFLWPAALGGDEAGKELPATDPGGRAITAACCAVSLAMYDASRHCFGGKTRPGSGPLPPFPAVRVSGVLGSADPARTARRLRMMRLYGLRDFKLKLGFDDDVDAANLRVVDKRIGKAVRRGKCTLRVDVNGAWAESETPDRVAALRPHGVCVVEQPVFGPPEALIDLAGRCELPLMADESLITAADADKLVEAPGKRIWLNVRLSKNGGIWHCLSIVEAAAGAEVPFTIGCMVGESSILSAAQRQLLWRAGLPRFVEGNYGTFLLADDLTARSIRFGYGGKLKCPANAGLGVRVDPRKIARHGTLVKALRA